jgi:flagellar motor switch protein FliN
MRTGAIVDVGVPTQVVLGCKTLTLGELGAIGYGSIIELDSIAGEPVDLVAAGEVIAKGEVVVIDEHFGIRVTELRGTQVPPGEAR